MKKLHMHGTDYLCWPIGDNEELQVLQFGGAYYVVDYENETIRGATATEVFDSNVSYLEDYSDWIRMLSSDKSVKLAKVMDYDYNYHYYKLDYNTSTVVETTMPQYYFTISNPLDDEDYDITYMVIYDSSIVTWANLIDSSYNDNWGFYEYTFDTNYHYVKCNNLDEIDGNSTRVCGSETADYYAVGPTDTLINHHQYNINWG